MKLKKIASLMLAGVMAVSMLAGCGEGSSSSSESNSTATVTSSDSASVAEVLNDARTNHAKNAIELTYKASSSLEEMLKSIVTDKYAKDSAALEDLTDSNNFAAAAYNDLDTVVTEKLSPKVAGGISSWSATLPIKEGVYKYARIYYVGGGYTAKEAANSAATNSANTNVNKLEEGYLPLTNTTGDMRADYTAEVAAVKMTSNAHTDQSVWFIAVLYTQTVTAK